MGSTCMGCVFVCTVCLRTWCVCVCVPGMSVSASCTLVTAATDSALMLQLLADLCVGRRRAEKMTKGSSQHSNVLHIYTAI